MTTGQVSQRVAKLLQLVGLHPDDGNRFPHQFSGGQRQRIAIARALAATPEFIICDEPTSALDVSVQSQILNLLKDIQEQMGLTYLFITHNLAAVNYMADVVGVMYLGRLVEVRDKQGIFTNPQHPYTQMLMCAVSEVTDIGVTSNGIVGEAPSPIDPPPGCAFHPRCPLAMPVCRKVIPSLIDGVACHAVNTGEAVATGVAA
jgi:peptide/nickel transport system ATP-binding protein